MQEKEAAEYNIALLKSIMSGEFYCIVGLYIFNKL